MITKKVLSAIFAIAALSACATQLPAPTPTPQDGASAGIGVLVKTRAPTKLVTHKVDSVTFARLEGNDTSQYISTQLITSNYNEDGYIYLLNAPPGRYAAVATFRLHQDFFQGYYTRFHTYFSRDLVKATEVTVEPGRIVVMGEFKVDTSDFKDADDVQSHYLRLISPGLEGKSTWAQVRMGVHYYTGTLHEVNQDEEARERFLATTRENLGEVGWLVVD